MRQHQSLWSWISSRTSGQAEASSEGFREKILRKSNVNSSPLTPQNDEIDNPWVDYAQLTETKKSVVKKDWLVAETSPAIQHEPISLMANPMQEIPLKGQKEKLDDMTTDSANIAPSRWVTGEISPFSPYGSMDDDGTLRQVESHTWRNPLTKRGINSGRFVPTAKKTSSLSQSKPMSMDAGSSFMWKMVAAVFLVALGVFATRSQNPIAGRIRTEYNRMFSVDFSHSVTPIFSDFIKKLHIPMISFGASAAVYLHAPVVGKIISDYSNTHPEMVLQSSSNAPVLSAGSGTVNRVQKIGDTYLVEINNGTYGDTFYNGLSSVSISNHEYVYAGEVIGRLPKSSASVDLSFAMMKNGKYINPHEYIRFSERTP